MHSVLSDHLEALFSNTLMCFDFIKNMLLKVINNAYTVVCLSV